MRTKFYCHCGCGDLVVKYKRKWNHYINGHFVKSEKHRKEHSALLKSRNSTGANNPNWKGGGPYVEDGRVCIRHPITGNKIKRARYVMEQKLGRPLLSTELVHHINEITEDDHPDNLEIKSRGAHATHHHKGKRNSKETIRKMSQSKMGHSVTNKSIEKMKVTKRRKYENKQK